MARHRGGVRIGLLLAACVAAAGPMAVRAAATGDPVARVEALLRADRCRAARAAAESLLAAPGLPDTAGARLRTALAEIELAEGRYRQAERLMAAADSCRRRVAVPARARDAVRDRLVRGGLALRRGDPSRARILAREALSLLADRAGPDDPLAVRATLLLSGALRDRGELAVAEALVRRRLAAVTAACGDTCGAAARLTLELATLLGLTGDDPAAVAAYHRAMDLAVAAWGRDDPRIAPFLAAQAHVRTGLGDLAGAAALYREALALTARHHAFSPPETADWRCRLALYDLDPVAPDSAARVMTRGLAVAARAGGRRSPAYALLRRLEAQLLLRHGRAAAAVAAGDSLIPVLRAAFGSRHPYLGMAWKTQARALLALGRVDAALAAADSAAAAYAAGSRLEQAMVGRLRCEILLAARRYPAALRAALAAGDRAGDVVAGLADVTSEREATTYARYAAALQLQVLKVLAAWREPPAAALADIYTAVARGTGRVLSLLVRRRRYLRAAEREPAVAAARRDRRRAVQQLAALETAPPGPDTERRRREVLADLDAAGRRLAAAAADLRRRLDRDPAPAAADPTPGRVAAALPEGTVLVHAVQLPGPPGAVDDRRYGAFLLRSGGRLQYRDLGPAAVVDSLVAAWRTAVATVPPGRRPTAREEAACRRLGEALAARIWTPLFDGAPPPEVLVVPDAALWGVDLGALPVADGRVVEETTRIRYLAGERFLLAPRPSPVRGAGLLAVAADTVPGHPRLPAAAREVCAAARLFAAATGESTLCLAGSEATESALARHVAGRRAVHLALHAVMETPAAPASDPLARVTRPWLDTALLLWPAAGDDGRLTPLEIADLDLHVADWVVLSACATGAGTAVGGEGVIGPGRALVLAGARSVLLTLWPVRDATMAALMREVYRRLPAGVPADTAVHAARLTLLAKARRRWHRTHPALWAGVVVLGSGNAVTAP